MNHSIHAILLSALAAFSLVSRASTTAAENASPLTADIRVMSFNIRYGTAEDGPNRWELRKPLVIQTIRDFDPDLMGTQETLEFQAEHIRNQFPAYDYVGRSREPDNQNGEQCGVFFRRERFDKLAEGHFWLSETPSVPGSKSWDSSLPRMLSWVVLHDRQRPGKSVCFFNTHFDHRGSKAREESAKLIRGRALGIASVQRDPCIILTGDFNTPEDSAPYNSFSLGTGNSLVDTYRVAHPERQSNEGTFGGWRGNRNGPRIDWILASPSFQVVAATIDLWNQDGRYPSDHYPVTAQLRYPK